MQIIGSVLRSIMRSTGAARDMRARPWIGVLLLVALSFGAAMPPAPRACKLRGEIVLPDMDTSAASPATVDAAHDHGEGSGGAPDPGIVSSCSSLLAALPAVAVPTALPALPHDGASDLVLGFAASHDPPPPFRPPRLS